jgi:hypothetical protein
MEKYAADLENMMVSHYNSLGERAKRHYAGLEALKLGFGGQKYIYNLFNMSKNTLRKGILELKSGENISEELGSRQRRVGGGRKNFLRANKNMQSP